MKNSKMSVAQIVSLAVKNKVALFVKEGKLGLRVSKDGLSAELKQLLSENKAALIEYLEAQQQQHQRALSIPDIVHDSSEVDRPLSFAQQRLWFIDQLEGSLQYIQSTLLSFEGRFDHVCFERALSTLIERHHVLRTCFYEQDDKTWQKVMPAAPFTLELLDLTDLQTSEQQGKVEQLADEEANLAFDLTQDLMLRAKIIKLLPDHHILLLSTHHIATDGWSLGLFSGELSALYQAFVKGQGNPLALLSVQYTDYAQWQRNWLQGEVLDRQLGYWRKMLKDSPPIHRLPLDKPRPYKPEFAGANHGLAIDADLTKALRALCQSQDVTLFMLIQTVFALMLGRYSRNDDIVMGTPIAGRTHQSLEPLMGFFVNTLVLRNDLSGNPTFDQLLNQSKTRLLGAYDHQHIPFEMLVEALQPQRSISHNPLFQIIFAVENYAQGSNDLSDMGELSLSTSEQKQAISLFDLELSIVELSDSLMMKWVYNKALFVDSTIAVFAKSLLNLLGAIVQNPTAQVAALPLLSDIEHHGLQAAFVAQKVAVNKQPGLHQLFEQQAEIQPDKVALVVGTQALTAQVLNEKANQLAHYLIELGVKPNTLVGIELAPSQDYVIALLAVLKAGGGYVGGVIGDTKLVLDENRLDHMRFGEYSTDNPVGIAFDVNQLAAVQVTSGLSSGTTKNVRVSHQNLLSQIINDRVSVTHEDVVGQLTSGFYHHGALESLRGLCLGAKVVVIDEHVLTLDDFAGVTVCYITPTLLNPLISEQPGCLNHVRCLMVGGEPLNNVDNMPDNAMGVFGSVEAGLFSLFNPLQDADSLTIGKPGSNVQAYVLDSQGAILPDGAVGELAIGGLGVALGYLDDGDDETPFIRHPLGGNASDNVCLTGDLVRRSPDGNLTFIGRKQYQVMLPTGAVDTPKIEQQLNLCDDVTTAVISGVTQEHQQSLVAYVVTRKGMDPSAARLVFQHHLDAQLPAHLVPATYVLLDSMPLTSNGKVDRNALPAPADSDKLIVGYVAPINELQQKLCELYQELLAVDKVGINDNFFHLGGHSLSATRLVIMIRSEFNIELPLSTLFEHPSVAGLALELAHHQNQIVVPPITRLTERDHLPLSFAQQRLWIIDQLEGDSSHYNQPSILLFKGALNQHALEQAMAAMVSRHEVFHTCFGVKDGEPFQQLIPEYEFVLKRVSLYDWAKDDRQSQVDILAKAEAEKPFDLSRDLMLRATLLNVSVEEHVLLLTTHHIAFDGWSLGIFMNELNGLYNAFAKEQDNPLTPLPLQYADYALWQRDWLQGEVLDSQLDYWRQRLAGIPAVHDLPLDKPRPATMTFEGAVVHQLLDSQLHQQLNQLCQAQDVTLFMLLQSAFSVLLGRYSNQTDIVIGTPIAGRTQQEVEPLIGFFVNTLVLRSDLSDNPSFATLLADNKTHLLDAYRHQHVPFEMLVEILQPQRSMTHNSLFQVMLSLQNNQQGEVALDGLAFTPIEQQHQMSLFDLELSVIEANEGLGVSWQYNTALFERETIDRLGESLALLLQGIVDTPNANINQLPILSAMEQQVLLATGNDSKAAFAEDNCIHELFERQAAQNPSSIALVDEYHKIDYQTVNERANQLAHYLLEQGVKPDALVGLVVERSADMIVAVLAILKAGGAYLPIDPTYPPQRIEYMLSDSSVELVLVQQALVSGLGLTEQKTLCLDNPVTQALLTEQPKTNIDKAQLSLEPNNLAYVIYTSGSTGQPKGVMVEHRGLCNLACAQMAAFEVEPTSRVMQFASMAFDASVSEWAMALCAGAQLHIVSNQSVQSTDLLNQMADLQGITHVTLPPVILPYLNIELWTGVTHLVVAGEACSLTMAQKWSAGRQFYNAYGPSEATVCATIATFNDEHPVQQQLDIGKPMTNTQAYVLDGDMQVVPTGVVGQLYIGGAGLARGYLNRDELTAERFVATPFSVDSSERLYQTGDLVRRLVCGNLVFAGRVDDQVKVRGFRVELGEIEHQIKSVEAVKDAAVLVVDGRLVGYVVYDEAEQPTTNLQAKLQSCLPEYMVPTTYVVLPALPLTTNGKIDRKALLAQSIDAAEQEHYVAPRNEQQQTMAVIWSEVLSVEKVGIEDNFFHLGGHSLLAMRLLSRIRESFGVELPLRALFEQPTVAGLVLLIDQVFDTDSNQLVAPPIEVATDMDSLVLSFSQQRLWFIDQFEGSSQYNQPLALALEGTFNHAEFEHALASLIERHQVLRTCFIERDGVAYQSVQNDVNFSLETVSLTDIDPAEIQAEIDRLSAQFHAKPFDLSRDLMLRSCVLNLSDTEHLVLITTHHIASDGWSLGIFINELSHLYNAFVNGNKSQLMPLDLQYHDYAQWQRQWLQGDVLQNQLEYWQERLADLPVVHNLPLDHPRGARQTFVGGDVTQQFDGQLTAQISQLCQTHNATTFMFVQTALSILLGRYSDSDDIVLGTPMAGRTQQQVEPLIGFFVNSLVLRCRLNKDMTFAQLLADNKKHLLDAYAHQHVPFEMLVEQLQSERSLSHSPLFQVMLTLQNNQQGELNLADLQLKPQPQDHPVSLHELELMVFETDDGLVLNWSYNTDLFVENTIKQLADSLLLLVQDIIADPAQNIFALDMMNEPQRQQIVEQGVNRAGDINDTICIHQLIEQQAKDNPTVIAVQFEAVAIDYATLNQRANQLARYLLENRLVEQNGESDTLVGLAIGRNIDMMVGLLAILKAGGAYLPIDPNYPAQRIDYMLSDAKVELVLTTQTVVDQLGLTTQQGICLDDPKITEQLSHYSGDDLDLTTLKPSDLAYLIYTSGSTGKPKGVMLEHANVVNYIRYAGHAYLSDVDCSAVSLPLSFDATVTSLLAPLCYGKIVQLLPETQDVLTELPKYLGDSQKTWLFKLTPAHLTAMLSLQNLSINAEARHVLVIGAEQLATSTLVGLQAFLPNAVFINEYGPTETVVGCSTYRVDGYQDLSDFGASVPIGKPIDNTQLLVLDGQHGVVPNGVQGELFIGGAGVGRGYLNQPQLTHNHFVQLENLAGATGRFYKTGDWVRWTADGQLEFIGRVDHQLKLRGFRIESGEIEYQLMGCPKVKECVVLLQEGERLVAFVVGLGAVDEKTLVDQCRAHLHGVLPDYMVPSLFKVLDVMPLTANGKVDRKALLANTQGAQSVVYRAPRNETEQQMCEIWQTLLGQEQVGIDHNFFHLGGHSLLATRLVSAIRSTFVVELPLRVVFEQPTVAQLAKVLSDDHGLLVVPPITALAGDDSAPLSFAQQRLWFVDQLEGGSSHYNQPNIYVLEGAFEMAHFERALSTMIERHQVLRSCYVENNGTVGQKVLPMSDFALETVSLVDLPADERDQQMHQLADEHGERLFDLSQDMMIRCSVIKMTNEQHILLLTTHHIATDGWSLGVMINELNVLYNAYAQGQDSPLPALAVQYADYATWQRNWLQGEVLNDQLGYWMNRLVDIPPVHSLPLDKLRPAQQTFEGRVISQKFEAPLSAQVKQLCQQHDVTLFMLLQTAFAVLLGKYSNESDIVMGTPIAGRNQQKVEPLVGFFLNNLVLRCDVSGQGAFGDLLKDNKGHILDAFAHQHIPFEMLVEALQPQRSLSHGPLYQVVFAVQNFVEDALELPGLTLKPFAYQDNVMTIAYELGLHVTETDEDLLLQWSCNSGVFEEQTLTTLAQSFQILIEGIISDSAQNIDALPILSEPQQQVLLHELNDTSRAYPQDSCIHHLFEQQAELCPDAEAVSFEGQSLSYQALNEQANQLARHLVHQGIEPDTLVGLCVERSLDMIVALLAILKAGGAYVPIDPEYPEERIEYMLEDGEIEVVLTQRELMADLQFDDLTVLPVDADMRQMLFGKLDVANLNIEHQSSQLAYVIYTSGSTGTPKGVLVSHQNVVRLVSDQHYVSIGQNDVLAHGASIAFDAATFEIWGGLCNGAKVVFIDKETLLSPPDLAEQLHNDAVTVMFVTTALLNQVVFEQPQCFANLSCLLFGGEQVNYEAVQQLIDNGKPTKLLHVYGPTETTTFSTFAELDGNYQQEGRLIAIGGPLSNVQHYVLDRAEKLSPIGGVGELCIGGRGVARGYLNQPELSAEKFIDNPFVAGNERLYKTGDLVRWLGDGELEFIGRVDHQVKIRGFRIELGEIELQLAICAGVKEALVVALDVSGQAGKRLVAYVVPEKNGDETVLEVSLVAGIKSELQTLLPDYMMPGVFVVLPEMPLNSNGKVDRKALPEPQSDDLQQAEYVAPSNEVETQLCGIFEDVLSLEKVGIHDNFFSLGGDSILSIQVVSKARESGLVMSVKDLFKYQIIAQLAEQIINNNLDDDELIEVEPFSLLTDEERAGLAEDYLTHFDDIYPMSELQLGMVYHTKMDTTGSAYNCILSYQLAMPWDEALFAQALTFMINQHPVLRTGYDLDAARGLQYVNKTIDLPLVCRDIRQLSPVAQNDCIGDWVAQHKTTPFDWRGPLFKVFIHRLDDDRFEFGIVHHHAVYDGWSQTTLTSQLFLHYQQLLSGEALNEPVIDTLFRDFIALEHRALANDKAKTFWLSTLESAPSKQIPTRIQKPGEQYAAELVGHRAERFSGLSGGLITLAKTLGVPLQSVLLAGHSKVMSMLSGQSKAVTSVVLNGRPEREGGEGGLGLFLNALPLCIEITNGSWQALIEAVAAQVTDIMSYRHYPSSAIQRDSGRDFSEILFNYTHFRAYQELKEQDEVEFQSSSQGFEQTNYGFTIDFSRMVGAEQIILDLAFDESLYKPAQVRTMGDYYYQVFESMLANLNQPHDAICLLGERERQKLLETYNKPLVESSQAVFAHKLFEQQMVSHPLNTAVVYDNQSLSYQALNEQANQLAHYLIEQGVKPDTLIAVCVERSLQLPVALLGILKAGGAYVPINPQYPQDHIKHLLRDSKVELVVTARDLMAQLPLDSQKCLCLDDPQVLEMLSNYPQYNVEIEGLTSQHLAYVIYTSGTTGKPKGVAVEHQNLSNYIGAIEPHYQISATDRVLQFSSLGFDACVEEVFGSLTQGATLVLRDDEMLNGFDPFWAFIKTQKITVVSLPTAYWQQLVGAMDNVDTANLRLCILGGEAVMAAKVNQWLAKTDVKLLNTYGPTEATVVATVQALTQPIENGCTPPIGAPMANYQCYVLDSAQNLSPSGVVGELYIGGASVAREYLNQPELSADKFIDNPYDMGRMYRTGDLVRWLDDGALEYIGRDDHQVKIRGFRIEPGEIEHHLASCEGVKEVVVMACEDDNLQQTSKYLAAYIVTNSEHDHAALSEQYRTQLQSLVPPHMMPSAFVIMDEMPLTPNGKIDRKALPAADRFALSEYVAPSNDTEQQLCDIWAALFGHDKISIEDNFFLIGGHSLLLMQLVARIKHQFAVELPFYQIVHAQTIKQQAELVLAGGNRGEFDCLMTLRKGGDKPPIFMVPGLGGHGHVLHEVAVSIDSDYPVYAFNALGIDGQSQPHESVEAAADYYVQRLLEQHHEGPCYLLGYSLGAPIAMLMAKILASVQRPVPMVMIIDGFPYCEGVDVNAESAHLADEEQALIAAEQAQWQRGLSSVVSAQMAMDYQPDAEQVDKIVVVQSSECTQDLNALWQPYSVQPVAFVKLASDHHGLLTQPVAAQMGAFIDGEVD